MLKTRWKETVALLNKVLQPRCFFAVLISLMANPTTYFCTRFFWWSTLEWCCNSNKKVRLLLQFFDVCENVFDCLGEITFPIAHQEFPHYHPEEENIAESQKRSQYRVGRCSRLVFPSPSVSVSYTWYSSTFLEWWIFCLISSPTFKDRTRASSM